ncbi:hypothetical protein [Streptomyces sp. NPDC000405]
MGGALRAPRGGAGDPRDALECFGSAPVDLLALGPYAVRRTLLCGTPEEP